MRRIQTAMNSLEPQNATDPVHTTNKTVRSTV